MAILERYHDNIVSILHIVVISQSIIQIKVVVVIIVINAIWEDVGQLKFVWALRPVVEVLEEHMGTQVEEMGFTV